MDPATIDSAHPHPLSSVDFLLSTFSTAICDCTRFAKQTERRKWTPTASNPAHPHPLSSVDFRHSTFCILICQQPQFDNRDREILSRLSINPVFDPGAGLSMSGENLLARITTDPAMPSTANGPVPLNRPTAARSLSETRQNLALGMTEAARGRTASHSRHDVDLTVDDWPASLRQSP